MLFVITTLPPITTSVQMTLLIIFSASVINTMKFLLFAFDVCSCHLTQLEFVLNARKSKVMHSSLMANVNPLISLILTAEVLKGLQNKGEGERTLHKLIHGFHMNLFV